MKLPGFLTDTVIDRIKLAAVALVITALVVMAWQIRELHHDKEKLETANAELAADNALKEKTLDARDAYIAQSKKSQAANRDFLTNQIAKQQGLKNAPIDPNILGPDFFNSLCRDKPGSCTAKPSR